MSWAFFQMWWEPIRPSWKFFQGQHQSHPHINIAIHRMCSYFWSGAYLLQYIRSRGLRSHRVSSSEWWWWSGWSWWSKWSTGLSGPHFLFGVFLIIRKVSFLLFLTYCSVRCQICPIGFVFQKLKCVCYLWWEAQRWLMRGREGGEIMLKLPTNLWCFPLTHPDNLWLE